MRRLSTSELSTYLENGFVIAREFCPLSVTTALREAALLEFAAAGAPIELEADLGYPGAPGARSDLGGHTIRRLLNAVDRQSVFREWLAGEQVSIAVRDILGEEALLSRVHHNCIMTKHPEHGSQTGWHRDIRYWSFARPELVSAWLALGYERPENGSLMLVPGSHSLEIEDTRFDSLKFLRTDIAENARLLDSAVRVSLNPGDVLFFHCRALHAAGRNSGDSIKYSLVSTYYGVSNSPIEGTRSASLDGIPVGRD